MRLRPTGSSSTCIPGSDGQLVIFHDFNLENTSNGAGPRPHRTPWPRSCASSTQALRPRVRERRAFPRSTRWPTCSRTAPLVGVDLKSVRASSDPRLGQDVAESARSRDGRPGRDQARSTRPAAIQADRPQGSNALLLAVDSPGWMKSRLMFSVEQARARCTQNRSRSDRVRGPGPAPRPPVRVWTVSRLRRCAGSPIWASARSSPTCRPGASRCWDTETIDLGGRANLRLA